MSNIKFKTLEDVRAWKQLKKDELDLAKLKLEIDKEQIKTDVVKKISKFIMFEVALVLGQKALSAFVKKVLKSVFVPSKTQSTSEATIPSETKGSSEKVK